MITQKFEVKMLPTADLQVQVKEDMPYLDLLDEMKISREKRKKMTAALNGVPVINNGIQLQKGDKVVLHSTQDTDDKEISFEPVEIVYEDDTALVANKPPFMLVHGDGNDSDTLTARVNGHLAMNGWPYAAQPVHRIDYEAQGLVLFCKQPLLQAYYDEAMQDKKTTKEYLAVIDGSMAKKHVDLNNPIARDRHDARKMLVFKGGKPSHTHIETLKNFKGRSLLKATITTGRKHQIRVHLANNGHPIVNDSLYGDGDGLEPLMLQSSRLVFPSPFTDTMVEVEAPFPKTFRPFKRKD